MSLLSSPWSAIRARVAGCAGLLLATVVSVGAGCGQPKYPNCDNDQQCNVEGHHGFCVNQRCVECRDDSHCGAGKQCSASACVAIAGYCDESRPCVGSAECGPDHRCHDAPQVAKSAVECDDNHPCSGGAKCQNGHCVAPPRGGPGCQSFEGPRFEFESSGLHPSAKPTLERLVRCMTSGSLKGARVLLVGHCDPRGESEFNMGLGAQRAETVKAFLVGLGVAPDQVAASSRGELDARGTDEAGWADDRRVDIEVR